jgi:hypothetical protein
LSFAVQSSPFLLLRLGGAENGEPPNAEPERRTANAEPERRTANAERRTIVF